MNTTTTPPRTGIDYIAQERTEQIIKHNRTIQHDVNINNQGQLTRAAYLLLMPDDSGYRNELTGDYFEMHVPDGWDLDIWKKMIHKPYHERVIMAGALCAAYIDRNIAISIRDGIQTA